MKPIIPMITVAIGGSLLLLNLAGFLIPLRAPDVSGYIDFAGSETRSYPIVLETIEELRAADITTVELVTRATRLFHDGMAHIHPEDVRSKGLDHYRMRVPLTENWILFALSWVKPDTYRDYEFCSYHRALERGVGRCGQQSLALVSFLSDLGVRTGFVSLGGHAVATADVGDSVWYLLDPDYGGVIPFSIDEAERNPASVIPFYWSSAAARNNIHQAYAPPENRLRYGGPEARFGRACRLESIAYASKWLFPLLLIVFAATSIAVNRRRTSQTS